MVKPIPVFAFVFAAYAATHESARRDLGDPRDNRDAAQGNPPAANSKVLTGLSWRMLARQGADVWVKVGVVENGRRATRQLVAAPVEPGENVEEIWLGQIVETTHGFSGVVTESRLSRTEIGERMRFARIHVLGWTTRLASAASETVRVDLRERAPV
jgi:hypothetical protein